jgi:hypothetical protein
MTKHNPLTVPPAAGRLADTANALRNNLLHWRELQPQACRALRALEAFERAAASFDAFNAMDDKCFSEPDETIRRRAYLAKLRDANKADRADRLGTLQYAARLWLPVAKEFAALVTSIQQQTGVVARAAEEAGIDSAALLLFAADFDGRYWEPARAVVERVSARTTNKPFLPTDRQKRILDMLDGETKKLAQLADTLKVRPSTLSGRDLKELRDQELVRHDKRIGYYRPDAPPPELSGTLR